MGVELDQRVCWPTVDECHFKHAILTNLSRAEPGFLTFLALFLPIWPRATPHERRHNRKPARKKPILIREVALYP